MGTTQEYFILFWTNSGSSTQQNNSCLAIYLPSHKPLKYNEQDLLAIAGMRIIL